MVPVISFSQINLPVPFDRILRRLGFRSGVTAVSREEETRLRRLADEASDLIALKGAGRVVAVRERNEAEIALEDDYRIPSRNVAHFIGQADEILMSAATAGVKIIEAIRQKTDEGLLNEAAVFDAAASEIVDDALGWICSWYGESLRRTARMVSPRRYSAGYGDFSLSHQPWFFRILEMEKMGVSLNDRFIFFPEKTVTALAPVERIG